MEIVNPAQRLLEDVERLNNFRSDFRIPKRFRADLSDYRRSGYDRGHLVASANQDDTNIQNSETFLLSIMSPQAPSFNRQVWRKLEAAVRTLNDQDHVLETYVLTGPVFDFFAPISLIGEGDDNGLSIPVPSHFYKCVLTEEISGSLNMWAFEMKNDRLDGDFADFRVSTAYIEQRVGIHVWDNLFGPEMDGEKRQIRDMW